MQKEIQRISKNACHYSCKGADAKRRQVLETIVVEQLLEVQWPEERIRRGSRGRSPPGELLNNDQAARGKYIGEQAVWFSAEASMGATRLPRTC